MLKKVLSLFVISAAATAGFGQTEVVMGPGTDGTIVNTCFGGLYDSGGSGPATDYSNNENYVITICPDVPGDDITLLWTTFDLDCTDEIVGPDTDADRITIYDGDNTGAPTLGTYFCGEIDPFDVFGASLANPTGCLTIEFTSNAVGTGFYSAEISCETPCEPPTAMAEIIDADNPEGDSIAVCVGEEITFDDAGSTPGPSGLFTIENWVWHWLDGTDNDTLDAAGPVTHSFSEPGLYIVQLEVIDDNECSNTNTTDLRVFVTTYPSFDPFPNDTTICAGEEVVFTAEPEAYEVEWDGFPVSIYIEDNCMEDLTGIAQYTPMTITGYDPDISLSDLVPDVLSICVDIEHSFLGDFILQLQCPTGQIITLHEQLGGGTYLGVPEDYPIDCDDPSTFGVPWHYCFTEDAAETWEAAAAGVATIPEGDYLPIDDFSELDGCPINGTWNMIFTDMWGADDGSMPGWEINFADYLTPDVTTFTPSIGTGSDSSYWEAGDPTIIDISADADEITLMHTTGGDYTYTYHVVNSFGCAFDSTVTVTAIQPPNPDAGLDDSLCHDTAVPYEFMATVDNPASTVGWDVEVPPGVLSLFAPDDDVLDPTAIVSDPGVYDFVITATEPTGICPEETDTITITFSGELHETVIVEPSCALDDGQIIITSTGTIGADQYSIDGGTTWQPSNIFDGLAPGTYTVISMDPIGCLFESTVELPSPGDIGIIVSSDTTICQNGMATLNATGTGGADYSYHWSYGATEVDETVGTLDIDFSEAPVTVSVYATAGTGCVSPTETIEITVRPEISVSISADDQVCPGDESGASLVSVSGGDGAYTYSWTANGVAMAGETGTEIVTNPTVETVYCVTVADGCETTPVTICATTTMSEVLNPTFTSDITWGCEPTTVEFTNTTAPAGSVAEATWTMEGVEHTGSPVTHTFDEAGFYDISLEVVSGDGCVSSVTVSDYITVYAPPQPSFYPTPNPTNVFNTTVSFINTTSGNDNTYDWKATGATPEWIYDEENPTVTYPEGVANNYEVWLYATNEHGCVDSMNAFVNIVSDVIIYAPNIFTPDGDEFNENWRVYIEGIDIYDFHLTMFNRWGEIVWESFNPSGVWDGTYGSGGLVQDGTYVWVIEVKDGSTDERYRFNGTVNIVK